MELCLSLGDEAPEKPSDHQAIMTSKTAGLCINLSIGPSSCGTSTSPTYDADDHQASSTSSKLEVPVQLDLLPHTPVVFPRSSSSSRRFPWPTPCDRNGGGGCSSEAGGLDVNRGEEVAAESSSPTNSGASSFHMDIGIYRSNYIGRGGGGDRTNYNYSRDIDQGADQGDEAERASNNSRGSDEDDIINGNASRKKLRLSKEQSAFLEESFKEHHTLNPKQKLALAKQLNLRPRQVEVWFQNRRARTKLKQTEVDCEFLKRCCETLTEENRRLHKELQELRALKTHHHSNPFYMQSPATTLTMCPSCERTATTTNTNTNTNTNKTTTNNININNSIYRPN